jgi:hypothetical protein
LNAKKWVLSNPTVQSQMLDILSKILKDLTEMNKNISKPTAVGSGTYFECLVDVWEFEMKECKGDFHNSSFQPNGGCPDYMKAILKSRADIQTVNSSASPHLTPTRRSTRNELNESTSLSSINDSSSAGGNSARSRSSRESSSRTTSTTTRNERNVAKPTRHVFGAKNASVAHLFPPKSPVCQEFYENILPCICGPLDKIDEFETLKNEIGERDAVMTPVRAISECMQNELALPENHAPFYDEEKDQGTLILVPILKMKEALNWKKDQGYSVLVMADSSKTYQFCDMNHTKLPLTASAEDIETATQYVTDCMLSLGYSLVKHNFEPLNNPQREGRFDGSTKIIENRVKCFSVKVDAMQTLKKLITFKCNKVLTPKLKMKLRGDSCIDKDKVPKLLKIDFGNIPHFRCPHPMLLGFKAGVGLHKYCATLNPSQYESEDVDRDVDEYVKMRGSMMLLPSCGDPLDVLSCGNRDSDYEEVGTSSASAPLEITVPAETTNVATSEK